MAQKQYRWLPYLIAVLVFAAVSMAVFAPQLEGKRLAEHDIVQFEGMQRDMALHAEQYGENPYWTGRMFGGMPSDQIWGSGKGTLVKQAVEGAWRVPYPLGAILLAMLAFWAMSLLMGLGPVVGITPALGYGLSTYFLIIIGAGHITKLYTLAWAPLVMGGIFYAFRRDKWVGGAITAGAAAMMIGAGHYQIVYYFALIAAAYWISKLVIAIREKQLPDFAKITGVLALAAALALGANYAPLSTTRKYAEQTMRGGSELSARQGEERQVGDGGLSLDYATMWSYGIDETLNLLVPDSKGGASQRGFKADGAVAESLTKYNARGIAGQLPAYWGDQPMTAGPTYIGAVILLLAVAGLFALRGRCKWWIVTISVIAVLLAWGRNLMGFTELFFHHFPLYDKFRTVAMILVIVEWTAPLLAAMYLYKVWQGEADRRSLLRALYVVGGLTLFVALFGGMMWDFVGPNDARMGLPDDVLAAMRAERAAMLRSDAWRSLLLAAATAGAMLAWLSGKIKRGWAIALLAVLVLIDMIPVGERYFPRSSFMEPREVARVVMPTRADELIMGDTTPGFRVANLTLSTFQDATPSYFHRSVGGYHAAKLQRYQDLIDRHLAPGNMEVYNMLNTRWFIQRGEDGLPQAQYNPEANGAAWLVEGIEWVATPDEEIDALGRIDTKSRAVADARFEGQAGEFFAPDSLDGIELVDYRVNRLVYRARASKPVLAIFSEIYYPIAWRATIDGQPLDHFRADYVLRAAVIPAGEHQIVFYVDRSDLRSANALTLICSILVLAGLAAALLVPKFCRHGQRQ